MTAADRKTSTDKLMAECDSLIETKGVDYASKADTLANFKRNADRLGLTKYQVWAVYANKHIDAINNAIQYHPEAPRTENEGEPLRGRVADAINYLRILVNMMDEDAREASRMVCV